MPPLLSSHSCLYDSKIATSHMISLPVLLRSYPKPKKADALVSPANRFGARFKLSRFFTSMQVGE
jgi:hypothetical protein